MGTYIGDDEWQTRIPIRTRIQIKATRTSKATKVASRAAALASRSPVNRASNPVNRTSQARAAKKVSVTRAVSDKLDK